MLGAIGGPITLFKSLDEMKQLAVGDVLPALCILLRPVWLLVTDRPSTQISPRLGDDHLSVRAAGRDA